MKYRILFLLFSSVFYTYNYVVWGFLHCILQYTIDRWNGKWKVANNFYTQTTSIACTHNIKSKGTLHATHRAIKRTIALAEICWRIMILETMWKSMHKSFGYLRRSVLTFLILHFVNAKLCFVAFSIFFSALQHLRLWKFWKLLRNEVHLECLYSY